jgi:hypothetical protein
MAIPSNQSELKHFINYLSDRFFYYIDQIPAFNMIHSTSRFKSMIQSNLLNDPFQSRIICDILEAVEKCGPILANPKHRYYATIVRNIVLEFRGLHSYFNELSRSDLKFPPSYQISSMSNLDFQDDSDMDFDQCDMDSNPDTI